MFVSQRRRLGPPRFIHRRGAYPPWPDEEVVEKEIYEGFPSRADEGRMQAFHAASWRERADLVEAFEDDRQRELGRRIVFLEQPEVLRSEFRDGLETWLHNRRHGREGVQAGRTVYGALSELQESAPSDLGAQAAVSDIRNWLENMNSS